MFNILSFLSRRNHVSRFSVVLLFLLVAAFPAKAAAQVLSAPSFSQVIIFGDSLSDVGNVSQAMEDKFFIPYPSVSFNYADGRFTNSSETDPPSANFAGVWHEQLAGIFLNLPAATESLNGGSDYAFGGATTKDGSSDRTVFDNPAPFTGGTNTITIDNIGRQMDRYFNQQTVDPSALYIVWGGGNDLFDDDSAANVVATSHRMVALVNRLITAGAKFILVANAPPLGAVPLYLDVPAKQISLDQASSDYRGVLSADLDANALTVAGETPPTLYRLDIWSLFVRFVSNPSAYGLTDISHSARGNDSADPDQYLFWDDIHPTTRAHFEIARESDRVLSGTVMPTARALNLSTRADVQSGENVAIGGFIITGAAPKRVVLRGLGPSLTARGVQGALANPQIELFNGAGASVASNNDWRDTQGGEIDATTLAPTNDLESAIVMTLAPGHYTVVLSGVTGGAGVGLVEVYDVDPASDSTLGNVSTRGMVGVGDNVLIGGVIVGEGDDVITIVRAIGPSLSSAGIQNPLSDPTLALFDVNGVQIQGNDDWRSNQESAVSATLLAPNDDREAAIVTSLAPGHYTAIVRGKDGATGLALVEVYRVP